MSAGVVPEAQRPHIRVGLLSRHSILGGAVVLAVALIYIVAVPIVNGLVKGANPFEPGKPYVAFDSYQFTPGDGWDLVSANDLFVTISKAGATVVFTDLVPADQTPSEVVEKAGDALSQDQTTWVVGEPMAFLTDEGNDGAKLAAHTTNQTTETWAITDDISNLRVLATYPDAVWSALAVEVDAMVRSVVFLPQGENQ